MPLSLDFPEITDAFRRFLLLPIRPVAHAFEAIALWLRQRVRTANLLEQVSRGFPVVRFEGDAVALWLDRIQAGGLAPNALPNSYGSHFAAAGSHFVGGLGRVKEAVREELILPSTFGILADVVDAIAASVDRFAVPATDLSERLFAHSGVGDDDPMKRTAGDLWGEAALIWRSLAGSTNQLKGFVGHVGAAFHLPKLAAGDAGGPSADPNAIPSMLEDVSRLLTAGLLVIPILPAFAQSLWETLAVVIKFRVIEGFARIEAGINKLRRKVIDFFYVDLPELIRKGLSYAIAAQLVLIANIRFFTEFALGYGSLLVSQLQTFFNDLADYFNHFIEFINKILSAINTVLQFDVGALVSTLIGLPMPTITIDDLITAGTDVARVEARQALTDATGVVDAYVKLNPFIPDSISDRVSALPDLVWNALRKPPRYPAETSKVRWPAGYGVPNLFDTFFLPGLPGLRSAIDEIGRELPRASKDIFGAGSAALDVLGDEFADQADRAAQLGSTERFRRLAETADAQAKAAFGGEIDDLSKRIDSRTDPVAQSFETWLATGGFQLLGLAIPAYFHEIQEYWHEREAQGQESTVRIDMTSPRILAERALLARAKVRQVIINAAGKPVGRELAAEIAARFQAAVQQAYVNGQARLKVYAASEYL
jgi:hypothetical protein